MNTVAARILGRFARSERASIALMFALMLPVLFGIIGLGVETGIWFKERRELQTMADAAAVSAAIEAAYGATSAEVLAAAQLEANNNGFDATKDTIVWANVPQTGTYAGQSGYIEVRISRNLETILSQVFTTLNPVTTARAVASTTGDKEACVLALDASASGAIGLSGGANVTMTGCGVVANSNHSLSAVDLTNNTNLTVDCLWSAGGIDGEAQITTTTCSSATSNASPISDPFATLDVPANISSMSCASGTAMTGAQLNLNSNTTLSEGRYCKGLKITGGDITLNPGTYIMDSGDFDMTGGTLTGSDVTIILTSSTNAASNTGTISLTGNGAVTLSAPTAEDTTGTVTGDYTGILVYQDRDFSPPPNTRNKFTGGSVANFAGALYTPAADIDFTGGNSTSGPDCLMLVGQKVSFTGDAQMGNDCDLYGTNPITFGARPGLVE